MPDGTDPALTNAQVNNAINAIRELLNVFSFERRAYVVVSLLSFLALLAIVAALVVSGKLLDSWDKVVALFIPGGAISVTCGQLLRLYERPFKIIEAILMKGIPND